MSIAKTRHRVLRFGRTLRSGAHVRLENLESRMLLSAISTYNIGGGSPYGITHDNVGNIWVAGGDGLYKVGPDGQQIGSPIATDYKPFDVVFNSVDGNLYFSSTLFNNSPNPQIVEVDPTDGQVLKAYTVPNPNTEVPQLLTVATDGSVWFTTNGDAEKDPVTGTNSYGAEIGRLNPSGTGTFTFATISYTGSLAPAGGLAPFAVAAAPDGSVWFDASGYLKYPSPSSDTTLLAPAAIGHAHSQTATDPSTDITTTTITIDPLYTISTPASILEGLTVASDGSVWFSANDRGTGTSADGPNRIIHGVLSSDTLTLVQTEYAIPGATDSSTPSAGAVAFDNGARRLWFTDPGTNSLSYLDTNTPAFTQMAIPSTVAAPLLLTVTSTDVWATAFPGSSSDNLVRLNLLTSTAPNIDATVGQPFDNALVTFQTSDDGPFTYTVDYGNGQTTTSSIPQDPSQTYTIPGNVTYATAGTYKTFVTITTEGGDIVTLTGTAIVTTSVNISATAGQPVAGTLVTFRTADNGRAAYSVDYGNGATDSGTLAPNNSGEYAIPANVTYTVAGTFDTSVTITTANGHIVTLRGIAIVTAPVQQVIGQSIDLSGPEDVALAANSSINGSHVLAVATFSGPAATYSATIVWGDNTTTSGQINDLGGGMFAVVVPGSKIYHTNDTFNGSVVIAGGPNTLTVDFTATISDTPLAVSTGLRLQLLNGRHINGIVATFTDDIDSTVSWFTATINWGDGESSVGVILQDPTTPGRYMVIGQHLYKGKKATYTVVTQITNTVEDTSAPATATITV